MTTNGPRVIGGRFRLLDFVVGGRTPQPRGCEVRPHTQPRSTDGFRGADLTSAGLWRPPPTTKSSLRTSVSDAALVLRGLRTKRSLEVGRVEPLDGDSLGREAKDSDRKDGAQHRGDRHHRDQGDDADDDQWDADDPQA